MPRRRNPSQAELTSAYRSAHPRSRVHGILKLVKNTSATKQMGCVLCNATGPTWSPKWRKTKAAESWEKEHRRQHEVHGNPRRKNPDMPYEVYGDVAGAELLGMAATEAAAHKLLAGTSSGSIFFHGRRLFDKRGSNAGPGQWDGGHELGANLRSYRNPAKGCRRRNPRKLIGWNRTQGKITSGWSDDNSLRYDIERNNVRGALYFTVTMRGEHIGDRGSLGLAKELAERDAELRSRRGR